MKEFFLKTISFNFLQHPNFFNCTPYKKIDIIVVDDETFHIPFTCIVCNVKMF